MKSSWKVVSVLSAVLLLTACTDRDRAILGGAAIGALAGAVVSDRSNEYHHGRRYDPGPPPGYYRYRGRSRHRYDPGPPPRYCRDQYGRVYPCD